MTPARLSLAAAVGIALAACAALALFHRDPRVRNFEVLPADMVRTPAAVSMGRSSSFPDGLVQRLPPAGTVSRDALILDYAATPEDAARAGRELKDPLPRGDAPGPHGQGSLLHNALFI